MADSSAIPSLSSLSEEERINIVRQHFCRKGYRVHSGLQFGTELVLYADDPAKVHSDFCVCVVPQGNYIKTTRCYRVWSGYLNTRIGHSQPLPSSIPFSFNFLSLGEVLDWRRMQTLVRSMPELKKTLILAHVRPKDDLNANKLAAKQDLLDYFEIDEVAIATEHAPFRTKHAPISVQATQVGTQRKGKKARTTASATSTK